MIEDKFGAEWVGAPTETENTSAVYRYSFEAEYRTDTSAGIVISARNKDNYTLAEIRGRTAALRIYSDSGVTDAGERQIPYTAIPFGSERKRHKIKITVDYGAVLAYINGVLVSEWQLPPDAPNAVRRLGMMSVGLKQLNSRAVYSNIKITNTQTNTVYQQSDFSNDDGLLSALGEVRDGELIAENRFELICPVLAVTVRRGFEVTKGVKSAVLYASARGFYDAYINGERVNADFYNPGFTDYRVRIQYQTYDVTDKIRKGENVIGAIVGKGYWSGYCGYSGAQIYGRQNAFICCLALEYEDGTRDTVVTDKTWEYTDRTPVMDSDYLDGETYDARIELDGFRHTGSGGWTRCGVKERILTAKPDNGEDIRFELSPQCGPPSRIECVLTPISEPWEAGRGHFVYDFGQNMVGTIRLTVKGERGMSLKLRYGEMCTKDGRLYTANLRNAANTDVYTLGGDKNGEVFVPSFTSHGFRYVEVSGNGYTLENTDAVVAIEGLVINNLDGVTGGFECSNSDINKLQSNIQWGQRGNSLLVLTDCPQRNERMGWTGDAQVFARTGAYNMNMKEFGRKWLRDLADAQLMYNKNGAVPDTVPLGGDNRADGCDGWGDAAVIVPWELYMAYGDVSILEESYESMRGWVEYQGKRQNRGIRIVDGAEQTERSDLSSEPYIQMQQRRGDHLADDITTPYILSATAYAAHSADIMARTAEILGKTDDMRRYAKRFENIKKAFNEAWVDENGAISYWGEMSLSAKTKTSWGRIGTDKNGASINETYYSDRDGSKSHPSQTAYALAIDFGLIDADKIAQSGIYLKNAVERCGGVLSVGFLGISHIIPALEKAGLTEEAFALLEQTKNPSWLYSVKNGATTIWERWDSYIAETGEFGNVNMNSFNHYAYGAVGEWLFGGIAGINAASPGYKKILLSPHFGGTLTYAAAWHKSPHGIIKSAWQIDGDTLTYTCTIPESTTAELRLHGVKSRELGSGTHEFKVSLKNTYGDEENV